MVALDPTEIADALRPWGGLHTLAMAADETRDRLIGSLVELPTAD